MNVTEKQRRRSLLTETQGLRYQVSSRDLKSHTRNMTAGTVDQRSVIQGKKPSLHSTAAVVIHKTRRKILVIEYSNQFAELSIKGILSSKKP